MSVAPSPISTDPATDGVISAQLAAKLCAQFGLTLGELMLALLPFATALAEPVVSNYHVGAVAEGTSGALYYGANLEFAGQALPFTVHAEQSATTNAWLNGETGLSLLAVSAAPCGYCRQFLYEIQTASTLQVLLPNEPATTLSPGLLPDAFGPSDLGVQAALMAPGTVDLQLSQPTPDPVVQAALAAAQASYAPYTKSYAGVAVLAGGRMFAGRLAENAAYNPSISPMESAMAMAALAGVGQAAIEQVALVELAPPAISQAGPTALVVDAIGDPGFSVSTAVPATAAGAS